jgi:hypothetical protein
MERRLSEEQTIWVTAVDGGWRVEHALVGALTFLTEILAQEKARALALWVAGLGLDARVIVQDQSRALLATARYFAEDHDVFASALLTLISRSA